MAVPRAHQLLQACAATSAEGTVWGTGVPDARGTTWQQLDAQSLACCKAGVHLTCPPPTARGAGTHAWA